MNIFMRMIGNSWLWYHIVHPFVWLCKCLIKQNGFGFQSSWWPHVCMAIYWALLSLAHSLQVIMKQHFHYKWPSFASRDNRGEGEVFLLTAKLQKLHLKANSQHSPPPSNGSVVDLIDSSKASNWEFRRSDTDKSRHFFITESCWAKNRCNLHLNVAKVFANE